MAKKVARALITDESGERLLLAKRTPDDYAGGLWSAFGGKVDPGETFERAVAVKHLRNPGWSCEVSGSFGGTKMKIMGG